MTLAEQIKQVMEYEPHAISVATSHYQDIIRQLTDIVKQQHEALERIQLYTVPDPSKPVPPHLANDLMVIERLASKSLDLSAPIVGV